MLQRQLQILSRRALRPQGLPPPAIQACYVEQSYRSFASRWSQDKKEKNEITLGELGSLALTKLKQLPRAISDAFSKIFTGTSKLRKPQDPWAGQASGLFGRGLMGRLMERTVRKALERTLKSMPHLPPEFKAAMGAQSPELHAAGTVSTSKVVKEAIAAICADLETRRHLGGSIQVTGTPVMQQTSVEVSGRSGRINHNVQLTLLVHGSNGIVALAEVNKPSDNPLDIQVRLPNGRVIRVDPGTDVEQFPGDDDDRPQGRLLDADWREVR